MGDELIKKKNTDCVYYLASPLTCRKGDACEFRHSEAARLYPKDCWFWMNGNCLNPNCGFRHPPLDGLMQGKPEVPPPPAGTSSSTTKANVPCHFFFNSYCIKGDLCPFSHGVPSSSATNTNTNTDASGQATTEINAGQVPPVPALNSMNNVPKSDVGGHLHHGTDIRQVPTEPTINPITIRINPVKSNLPKPQHATPPPPQKVKVKSRTSSHVDEGQPLQASHQEMDKERMKSSVSPGLDNEVSDQFESSPDETADLADDIEQEELLESSPGLDVLVDNSPEYIVYEEDPEYRPTHDRENEMLHGQFRTYDFEDADTFEREDSLAYVPASIDSYDDLANDYYTSNSKGRVPGHYRHEVPETVSSSRRTRVLPYEMNNRHRGYDLRDHLRKRMRMGSYENTPDFDSREYSHSPLVDTDRSRRTKSPLYGSERRLASQVTRGNLNRSELDMEQKRPRRFNRSRSRHERHSMSDRVGRSNPVDSRRETERRLKQNGNSFKSNGRGAPWIHSEPQHKHGERVARDLGSRHENSRHWDMPKRSRRSESGGGTSKDFEGPKPLSELLKGKGKPAGGSGDKNGEVLGGPDSVINGGVHESDFELGDEDGFAKRLVGVFSS